MTRRPPGAGAPGPGSGEDGGFARAEALSGLAREVDGLRRGLDPLAGMPGRVDDLARTVAQLADALAATPPRPGPTPVTSWLAAPPEDPEALSGLLEGLCDWLARVFLRYPDAASVLPECWLFHPDVIEELLWLAAAWSGAYEGKGASVQLAGDWHDRQRPGVVRRLKTAAGSCSIERHQTRTGWNSTPRAAVAVPGRAHTASIAMWWAVARDQPAPEPTGDPATVGAHPGRGVPGFDGPGPHGRDGARW